VCDALAVLGFFFVLDASAYGPFSGWNAYVNFSLAIQQ
jgi:hypothetical protein